MLELGADIVRARAVRGVSVSPCLCFPLSPLLPPTVPGPTPSLPPSPPRPTVLRVRLPASCQSAGHVPVHHRDPGGGVPAAAAALGRIPPPTHRRVPGAGGVLHEGLQGRAGIVRGQGQRVSGRCGRGKKGGLIMDQHYSNCLPPLSVKNASKPFFPRFWKRAKWVGVPSSGRAGATIKVMRPGDPVSASFKSPGQNTFGGWVH
jgi:hypothetical protein